MILHRIFLSISFWIICFTVFSQSPVFKQFTTDDGLPSNEVYQVIQDSKGYMWFATDYGVSCFNGYKFTNYDSQDGLPDNTVLELYEDQKGRIWFISLTAKLSYFYNGKIFKYKYNDILAKKFKSFSHVMHNSFYIDSLENIYIAANSSRIYKISPDGTITPKFNRKPPCNATIFIDKNKIYYDSDVGYFHSLSFNVDWDNGKLVQVKNMDNTNSGRFNILLNNNNELLFTKGEYLYIINQSTFKYQKTLYGKDITALTEDKNNNLWVSTLFGGAYRYQGSNTLIQPDKHYLNGKSVSFVYEDREGGLWFTTVDDGVFYMTSDKFLNYTFTKDLPLKKINAISSYNKNKIIYGGTGNDLHIVSDSSEKIATKKYFDNTNCLYYDSSENNLWIGTDNAIFLYKNKTIKHFNNYLVPEIKYKSKKATLTFKCYEIIKAKNNYIYGATNYGITEIRNEKESELFCPDFGFLKINSIAPSADSGVWLGTNSGLWKFKNRKFLFFGNKNKLFLSRINNVKVDSKNTLWISTKGHGLIVKMRDTTLQLLEQNGLSSNFISSLYVQNDNIWACSNNGLNKIEVISEKTAKISIEKITADNGLLSNEVNAVFVNNHIVYASTKKGLTVFDFSKTIFSNIPPPVYITKFSIKGRDTTIKQFIKIPYDQNLITINFVGLCYKKTGDVIYKYRLKGLSEKWTETKSNFIQFPYLPNGDYTFEVVAYNEDKIPSSKPAILHFSINPPFWKTWWFILLLSLSVILTFLGIYTYRVNEIKKRAALKDELNKYMQKALAKQMNPHFIFNALNSIHNFILENDKKASSFYLSKFAALMRQTLENSTKETITLADEINSLKLYFELEHLRFNQSFEYKITLDEQIDDSFVEIPPFLLQPFVENSLWHGIMHKKNGQGKIFLNFSIDDEFIICNIEDNGIGRKKAAEIKSASQTKHKSHGTAITEKRISILNSLGDSDIGVKYYDLYDEHNNAAGTRVTIKISMK